MVSDVGMLKEKETVVEILAITKDVLVANVMVRPVAPYVLTVLREIQTKAKAL